MSQLKPKWCIQILCVADFICPIFRLFSGPHNKCFWLKFQLVTRLITSQILLFRFFSKCPHFTEWRIYHLCHMLRYLSRVTLRHVGSGWHVTQVDNIVAHIDISLFPILRINSADDVISPMTSLKWVMHLFSSGPIIWLQKWVTWCSAIYSSIQGSTSGRVLGSLVQFLGLRSKLTSSC